MSVKKGEMDRYRFYIWMFHRYERRFNTIYAVFFSTAIFAGHTQFLSLSLALLCWLASFILYVLLGRYLYSLAKEKFLLLTGASPKKDDKFFIAIMIFSLTLAFNFLYFSMLRFVI